MLHVRHHRKIYNIFFVLVPPLCKARFARFSRLTPHGVKRDRGKTGGKTSGYWQWYLGGWARVARTWSVVVVRDDLVCIRSLGGVVYPSLRVGYLMNGKYLGAASQISEHSLNDLTQLLQAKFSRSSNVNLTALLE